VVGQTDRLPIANLHQRPSNDKEMSTAVIALRSASFDVIIDGRNVCRAHLVDIPTTLTSSSFNDLKATSSNPPTQPRHKEFHFHSNHRISSCNGKEG
jgi:hypothetical protein